MFFPSDGNGAYFVVRCIFLRENFVAESTQHSRTAKERIFLKSETHFDLFLIELEILTTSYPV